MTVHSLLKIILFFCAGSLLCQNDHKGYIWQYEGMGRRMPVTCAAFTLAGIGLIGVPPLPAFFSKWMIGSRAALTDFSLAWVGAFSLMVSAFLTALYILQVVILFYFPTQPTGSDAAETVPGSTAVPAGVSESGWRICFTLIFLCLTAVVMGLSMTGLCRLLSLCADGLL